MTPLWSARGSRELNKLANKSAFDSPVQRQLRADHLGESSMVNTLVTQLRIVLLNRDPFHQRIFHYISNPTGISFCFEPHIHEMIATRFCTWHDSCVVVARAKICSDLMIMVGNTVKQRFHWICAMMQKTLLRLILGHHFIIINSQSRNSTDVQLLSWTVTSHGWHLYTSITMELWINPGAIF